MLGQNLVLSLQSRSDWTTLAIARPHSIATFTTTLKTCSGFSHSMHGA